MRGRFFRDACACRLRLDDIDIIQGWLKEEEAVVLTVQPKPGARPRKPAKADDDIAVGGRGCTRAERKRRIQRNGGQPGLKNSNRQGQRRQRGVGGRDGTERRYRGQERCFGSRLDVGAFILFTRYCDPRHRSQDRQNFFRPNGTVENRMRTDKERIEGEGRETDGETKEAEITHG